MNFLRPFLVWSALGLVGVAALALTADPALLRLIESQAPGVPARLALVLQPAVLTLLGAAAGVGLSARAGLTSWITDRVRGVPMPAPKVALPIVLGIGGGVVITGADLVFFAAMSSGAGEAPNLGAARPPMIQALLYGGISEEILLRYGLLTVMFWAAAKSFGHPPGRLLGWSLVLLIALIFGLLHLPAMSQVTALTGPIVVRTILLNAALGTLFGWLYWRHNLESAVLAHMAAHVGIWGALGLFRVSGVVGWHPPYATML